MERHKIDKLLDLLDDYIDAIIRDMSSPSVEDAISKIKARENLKNWLITISK